MSRQSMQAIREASGMALAAARDDMDAFWQLWRESEDADAVVLAMTGLLLQFAEAHGKRRGGKTAAEVIGQMVSYAARKPDV